MVHFLALWQFVVGHPLALLLSVVIYMAIGFAWYGALFQKPWIALSGAMNVPKQQMRTSMMPGLTLSIITAFVQAVVIGRSLEILYLGSIAHAFIIAVLFWLPFTGLVLGMNYAYANKSLKLWCIDAGYALVGMWAMAAVLYSAVK